MSADYKQFFKNAKANAGGAKPMKREVPRTTPNKKTRDTEDEIRKAFGMAPQKKKRVTKVSDVPIVSILCLCLLISGFGWYTVDSEYFDKLLGHVQISIFGQALAKEGAGEADKTANNSKEKVVHAEKSAAASDPATASNPSEKSSWTQEEISHFSKLNERKEELDLREKELSELEEELQKQKLEVEKRIRELQDVRDQIATLLKDRVDVDKEKVGTLVEFYSNMKPKQAAEIIATINEDLAVEILGRMKKKNAAEIMNLLEPNKAQGLSEKFAGYKRR